MRKTTMEIVNPAPRIPPFPAQDDQSLHVRAWNALHAGLLIVDGELRVESMNTAARLIIERDDGLGLTETQCLHAAAPDGEGLNQALGTAAGGQVGAIAIWSIQHAQPYLVTVVQLEGATAPRAPQRFLVSIADPVVVPAEPVLKCARALGLTQGESCLALALVRGETVSENAQRRGVSIHTVRSQLRNIRDKLGLSRQSQLISWLTRAAMCTAPYPQPATPRLIQTRPRAAAI